MANRERFSSGFFSHKTRVLFPIESSTVCFASRAGLLGQHWHCTVRT
jgi:hypothetical protein